jgi:hypothetical protein
LYFGLYYRKGQKEKNIYIPKQIKQSDSQHPGDRYNTGIIDHHSGIFSSLLNLMAYGINYAIIIAFFGGGITHAAIISA